MNLQSIVPGSIEQVVQQLQRTIARINTVMDREHYADGKHKRAWFASELIGASNFLDSTGAAWTVPTITTLHATKVDTEMKVSFVLNGTTVTGTPAYLSLRIPGGYTALRKMTNMIYLTDNATRVDGLAVVEAQGTTINLYRADLAAFVGGTTAAWGQLVFETTT